MEPLERLLDIFNQSKEQRTVTQPSVRAMMTTSEPEHLRWYEAAYF